MPVLWKGKTRPKPKSTSITNQAEAAASAVNSSMGALITVFISSKAKQSPAAGAPKAAVSPATLPPMR